MPRPNSPEGPGPRFFLLEAPDVDVKVQDGGRRHARYLFGFADGPGPVSVQCFHRFSSESGDVFKSNAGRDLFPVDPVDAGDLGLLLFDVSFQDRQPLWQFHNLSFPIEGHTVENECGHR